MCGILCMLNGSSTGVSGEKLMMYVKTEFEKGSARGPEKSTLVVRDNIIFGFHRLAINGFTNTASGQPMYKSDCTLICNGEIYNWKELIKLSNSKCNTGSDCEIIIDLYKKYGISETLRLLDGVFAFVLVDHSKKTMYVARDGFGIRPLFIWANDTYLDTILFSSELKMGIGLLRPRMPPKPFPPGNVMTLQYNKYGYNCQNISRFYTNESAINYSISSVVDTDKLIRDSLTSAVRKRTNNTDREIACLLSGGLDSSLITSIVVRLFKEKFGSVGSKMVNTWSIGLAGSEDLKYARKVAKFLGTTHNEIVCSEEEFLKVIPEVIYAIESNDTTTIRASVGNYLICKYIKENSSAKVIFNGDGSDELTGGYLYFHYAPNSIEFDLECRRLLNDIHLFDVLRSDRCISSHGLEARTPFLDKSFVQTYLSIPHHLRNHVDGNAGLMPEVLSSAHLGQEKFLLRHAFSTGNYLPDDVLFRRKEAFSDGVSTQKKAWFEIIQEYAQIKYPSETGKEAEKLYYAKIFSDHFGTSKYTKHIMPYRWMPRFINATDASARTLPIYTQQLTLE